MAQGAKCLTDQDVNSLMKMKGKEMLRGSLPIFLVIVAGTAPAWTEPAAIQRGFAYTKKNCAECHAVEKEDRFSPEPSAPAFNSLANIPGVSWIALTAWLQRSHETMPDFIIPPHHREDIVAYILSLKEDGKPR